ncbi:hypothetical protein PMAC_001494 [Pneumocystis sp. 'macacae']|nr:hypothetical protein PMAC_001494 [Pneumocystis sp. 'macacae']
MFIKVLWSFCGFNLLLLRFWVKRIGKVLSMEARKDVSTSNLKDIPSAAYISREAAVSVILSSITEFKNSFPIPLDLSPKVLQLINEFLDYILFVFLKASQSISISCLRNSILSELPSQLGIEAMSEAEAELQTYIDEHMANESISENYQEVSLCLYDVWDKARAKCMIYSTLGDQEKENFSNTTWNDELISPSIAIYTTSILEFIAEHILLAAGNACRQRLNETKNSFPIVEEIDLNKGLESDEAIISLWNRWKFTDNFINLKTNRRISKESNVIVPIFLQEKTNAYKKSKNTKTEFNNLGHKIDVDIETNANIANADVYHNEFIDKISTHKLENSSHTVFFDNQTNLVTPIEDLSINTDTNERLSIYQKDKQNKLINQENNFKTIFSKIENKCEINPKVQQILSPKKEIFRSFSCKEKSSIDSSFTSKSKSQVSKKIEFYNNNDTLGIITNTPILKKHSSTNLIENNAFSGIPFKKKSISNSNIYENKSSFLKTISITNNINENSMDPFNINSNTQFSNIILKNQDNFIKNKKLTDEIQKFSLIDQNKEHVLNEEKNINQDFFIHNYNANYTNNRSFVFPHNHSCNSLYSEVSPTYKTLEFEQDVCNSPITFLDKDLETTLYTKNQNTNDTSFFKAKNNYFHSTDPDFLLEASLETQAAFPINKTKCDDSFISEISALDSHLKSSILYQNTNKLNSNYSQDKIGNKIENKNEIFDKLIDNNTTMKMTSNTEGLGEIDFNRERPYQGICHHTDISNTSNSYNKELINRYCDNTEYKDNFTFNDDMRMLTPKELLTHDSLNSLFKNKIKLEPREPTIPGKSTTDSLKEFLAETSFDEIHHNSFLNSKPIVKHDFLSKSFNMSGSDYLSKTEFEDDFKNDNDLNDLLKPYLKMHQKKEESLIEFLKNSNPININNSISKENPHVFINSIKSQKLLPINKKRNKSLLKKAQSSKDSSVILENNLFQKNGTHLGIISSNYIKNTSLENPYQTPESIERKNLPFLDDISLNSYTLSSQDFDRRNTDFQSSINCKNDSINELNSDDYSFRTIGTRKIDIEHKESLVDFLKNTSLNYNQENFINDSYTFKKKRSIFSRWKRKI